MSKRFLSWLGLGLTSCLVGVALLTLTSRVALAAKKSPFSSDYVNTYTIYPNGQALVEHQVTLTNKLSSVYITSYSLSIFHTRLDQIRVTYNGQSLPFKVGKSNGKVQITIEFPDQVIGINKQRRFLISYLDQDVAVKTGRVWEINIPTVKDIDKTASYQVRLQVPADFPPLLSSSPQPSQSDQLIWQKEKLLDEQGIKVIFGDYQAMAFELKYFLKNDQNSTVRYEIALPPDTDYQKVIYQSITPKPVNVRVDQDGNWLAEYDLVSGQQLNITATGQAWLFMKPRFNTSLFLTTPQTSWLQATQVWPADRSQIEELASRFKSVRQVYKYVVDKLDYSYQRALDGPDRMGAIGALKNPDLAVCMEYTDLFIAILRAKGIPAREINGYAYTANSVLKPLSLKTDVLHAWPEYFDRQLGRWRPVDPTWEDTTGGLDYFYNFDLNHFTFVIHGLNPYYPLPAGAYKDNNNPTKDVKVEFIDQPLPTTQPLPQFKLTTASDWSLLRLLSGSTSVDLVVQVSNPNQMAVYLQDLKLTSKQVNWQITGFLPDKVIIPPGGQVSYKVNLIPKFNPQNWLALIRSDKQGLDYNISFNQTSLNGSMVIKINKQIDLIILAVVVGGVGIGVISGLWLYWRKLRQTRL